MTQQIQQTHPRHRKPGRSGHLAWRPRGERPVKVVVDHVDDRPVVTVTGRVDRATITTFSGAVRALVAAGVAEMTVDVGSCWDGARLLTALSRTRRALVDRGGMLHVEGLALPEFLPGLDVAPLEEVFLVYDAVRHCPRHTRREPAEDPDGVSGDDAVVVAEA